MKKLLLVLIGLSLLELVDIANAERFEIKVTSERFDLYESNGWLELSGIVSYEKIFGNNCSVKNPRFYLRIWSGSSLISAEEIHIGGSTTPLWILRGSEKQSVHWNILQRIPGYLKNNFTYEIFVHGCDFSIRYP